MSDDVYSRLREYLHSMPGGYPATKTGVEIRLLKKLYTPEEAELFLKLGTEPEDVGTIAARCGLDEQELADKIEDMAVRGLVFRVREEDKLLYKAYQFFIGILDAQINRADSELADMMLEYFPQLGMTRAQVKIKQMRIIPARTAIEAKTFVQTYNRLRDMIGEEDLIAVAPCLCRQLRATKGRDCRHTLETCLSFGEHAQFYMDNGVARRISKDELMGILDLAEKEGLVLNTSNVQKVEIVCCCCSCCCGVISALKILPQTGFVVNTCFQAKIDPGLCSACGDCLERCPIGSIKEGEEFMEVNIEKCIGCGLCVTACPEDAISLEDRPEAATPYSDDEEMLYKVSVERGLIK